MAKVNAPLLSFNQGEVSKTALARVDNERLRLAAEVQVNWAPSVLGPMMLRPGLGYLGSVKSDAVCRPLEFVFANDDIALLELTANTLRVWVDDVLVSRASVSSTVVNGDFSSAVGWTLTGNSTAVISAGVLTIGNTAAGETASATTSFPVAGSEQGTEHALRVVVTHGPVTVSLGTSSLGDELVERSVLDTGTHSLAFTPGTGTVHVNIETSTAHEKTVDSVQIEAAGVLELPTNWDAADIFLVRPAQSGDVVFCACAGQRQQKIERRSVTSWSVSDYRSEDGPFAAGPSDASVNLRTTTNDENNTLLASRAFFKADHVGALIRLTTRGQNWIRILAGDNQFLPAIRVIGNVPPSTDRSVGLTTTGTWVGTLTLQRSYDGPDSGFVDVSSNVVNIATTINDGFTGEIWYRFGFKTGGYTSGRVTAQFSYSAGSGTGVARVLSLISASEANVEMLAPVSSNAHFTEDWQLGDWSDLDGWPSCVAIHDGRLWWAGRDKIWASVSDDYTSFDSTVEGESGTINRSFGYGPFDSINWLAPLSRLIAGRPGSEVSIRASAIDEPLTPTNMGMKDCSTQGGAALPALKVDTRGVFVEKSGRRVYELVYNPSAGDYQAHDLTRLNHDIGMPGFAALGAQRQPDTYLHMIRADGQAAVMLHAPEDQVECWTRTMTLGVIEAVAVLPGLLEDAVYYVVRRQINGATKRFLERGARRDQAVGGSLNRQADAFVAITQASSATITGLGHLEGESVVVWGNGKDLGSYTVSGGSITASEPVTSAIVGLGGVSFSYSGDASNTLTCDARYNGYPAEVFANRASGGALRYVGTVTVASGLVTLPRGKSATGIVAYLGYCAPFRSAKLAYAAQMGTALAQKKKISHVGLILYDTHYQGLRHGQSFDKLDDLPLMADGATIAADTVFDEVDDPMVESPGEWDTDARLCLLAQAPKPCTVAAVVVAVQTNEK